MLVLRNFFCGSLIAFLSVVSSYVWADPITEGDFLYTVKKDDTIWGICKTYVADPLCWTKLATFNQLKNPKYLPPNSVIRIPTAWLINQSATALVIAVEGDVLVVHESSMSEDVLQVGDLLNQEDVVKSQGGSAMIEFADNSRLLLKENSTIRMASLKFYEETQLVNTRVELLKGRVKAQVEKLSNKDSRYEISTPAAVAAVRGTEFRVETSEGINGGPAVMKTELLTGALMVSSDKGQQLLAPGEGVIAIEDAGVEKPVQLLPRPLLDLNESQELALPLLLKWKSVEKAVSYKVVLVASNVQVWEKAMKSTELLIEDVAVGDYQLLIRGVDGQGFEGRNRRITLGVPESNIPLKP
jgi:hypothetical protein